MQRKHDIAIEARLLIHGKRMSELIADYKLTPTEASSIAFNEILKGDWDAEVNTLVNERWNRIHRNSLKAGA